MANRNFPNGKSIYIPHIKPVLVDCNFVVDSTNGNGLGIRNLKGAYVQSVYMNVSINGLPGGLNMGTSRTYAILGASAVSNTGSSVLTGNLGLSPGTSVTGFPPGTFSGAENVANAAAATAQANALSAYNTGVAMTSTPISSTLDGQTLTPGVYSESSGTFNLAQSGNGTLTLNGAGVYIFKAASTLVTGAGGTPTITLENGATAANVYWLVGSSATINSGNAGTFQGNIIAHTSITDTSGGTINGSAIALTGAVTLSSASNINVQLPSPPYVAPGNPDPAPGYIVAYLDDNYNYYLGGFSGEVTALSGSNISSGMTIGTPYVITSLGSSTQAQWTAAGLSSNIAPAIGAAFIAAATSIAGGGLVQAPSPSGSGIDHIEVIGDTRLGNSTQPSQQGMQVIMACYSAGVVTAPANGAVLSLAFYMDDSSVPVGVSSTGVVSP